jgi:hypothetical protein
VVRVLRLFMAVAVLLPLGSCDVLFNGVFSPAIGQITARADFSASIAAAPASSFSLAVVSVAGTEFVLLFSTLTFDTSQTHLIVMDEHLNVLNTFPMVGLVASPNSGDPFAGSVAMTDINNQVLVGSVWFDVSATGFAFSNKAPAGFALYAPSVTGMPSFAFNEINFRVIGGVLTYDEYNAPLPLPTTWGYLVSPAATLGIPSPAPSGQLNLSNVFTDQYSAAAPDVLVFQDSGGNGPQNWYFLQVPKADIDANINVAIGTDPDVFTHAALHYPPLVVKTNLAGQSVGWSRAGVIAYDYPSHSLVRFTLTAPGSVSSLPFTWTNGMKLAAGLSGGYCVVWDPASRSLTRYEQWW